jgi:beta-lactamase superfamily II metal-dependent hydrolase
VKRILHHCLLASVLLFFFSLTKEKAPVLSFVLVCFFYQIRTRDRTVWFIMLILSLSLIPRHDLSYPKGITGGKVISVSSSSVIAEEDGHRFQVFTTEEIPPDAEIAFTGTFRKINSSLHFFSMDFSAYNRRRGIIYAVYPESLEITARHHTFRSFLYEKTGEISDEKKRSLSRKVLLGISDPEEESFFYRCGFSLTGLLLCVDRILGYFINEKKRALVILVLGLMLFLLYRFPLILFQACLFRILRYLPLSSDERIGIGFMTAMLVYPESVFSAAFLLPACYRVASLEKNQRKLKGFFLASLLQSYLFQGFNPLISLLFAVLRVGLGAGWLLCMTSILLPVSGLMHVVQGMDRVMSLLDCFFLPGSVYGIGFLFYSMILFTMRHRKNLLIKAVVLLFVFQIFGLFHPFMEISFINVGQGDSIFIKEPFSRHSVLVDTGKPNQYRNISSFLKAKGIRKLDALIITHGDDDHSGCRDRIAEVYQPDQIIESHQKKIEVNRMTFFDLNEIVNEDENQSTIVLYTVINRMEVLLMGDADQVTEEVIVMNYGNLTCDILKLSHHGSKTGSCDRFLDTVRPSLGIISSGAYRIYRHPSPETIQRLLKRHIPYLDTKTEGDITILCLPRVNLVLTASGKIGIINCDEQLSD